MKLDKKTNKVVVDKISKLLTERNIKRKDFAQLLEWNQAKLSKVLKGDMNLTFEMYLSMCKALDIEPQELHELSDSYFELRNSKGEWVGIVKKDQLKTE